MKTNALLAFFFFSAALFAITTAEIVLDSDGNPLKNGGNYSLSTKHPIEGGILGALTQNSTGSWSLAVVAKSNVSGWPTNIASPYPTQNITTYSPLLISFCVFPPPWTENLLWVVILDPLGETVMVGDAKSLTGRFFITPYDSAKRQYKLVFFYEQGKCGHVVLKTDSRGNNRLVVTEDEKVEPLVLMFHKEPSDEVVASNISMVV